VAQTIRSKPTLGAYLVGAYLFSVPSFAYSESLGLLIIPQIAGALLVAYAIFDILQSRSIKIPREIQLYGFMALWAVITFGFGESVSERDALGTLVKVTVATLACAQLIKNENDLFTALQIFVFSVLFVYFQNKDILQYLRMAEQIIEKGRFAGTLANANTAAIYSLTVIWASLLLFLRSRKWFIKWILFLIPTGISLLIIYYSGSKKGLIGLGLFVLFYVRLMYKQHGSSSLRKSMIVLISIFLIVISGYFIYTSPFFFRVEQLFYGGSISDINRLILAKEAIHVWLMNLKTFFFGVGYDNFRLFSEFRTYSHSTLLELLSCTGIIGFILFIGFLFLLSRKFIFLYKNAYDQESKGVFFTMLIFLTIFSFFMLAAVLQASRELLPMLGCIAAFGQYRLQLLSQS